MKEKHTDDTVEMDENGFFIPSRRDKSVIIPVKTLHIQEYDHSYKNKSI